MEKVYLTQNLFVTYIQCGLYKKTGCNRVKILEFIKEDIELIEKGTSFEDVVLLRKVKEGIVVPKEKKMPCGASSKDPQHYPILHCEYCEHKLTEAAVPGFC